MLGRLERGGVVIAQGVARVLASSAVAGELDHREPGGLGPTGREDLPLVPLKRPERGPDAIPARVERGVPPEVVADRLLLAPEDADGAPGLERAHRLVGPLIVVPLLAGRRVLGVGLPVAEEDGVPLHRQVGVEASPVDQRQPRFPDGRGGGPGRDGEVEGVVGGLDVPGEVDVREAEGLGVLVEAVRRAVGRQEGRERGARHVEEVADGVLVLRPGQATERRPSRGREPGVLRVGQRPIEPAEQGPRLVGRRPLPPFRRHLAGFDAIIDLRPACEVFRVGEVRLERGEVEPAFPRGPVMAAEASGFEDVADRRGHLAREALGRAPRQPGRQAGSDRDPDRDPPGHRALRRA